MVPCWSWIAGISASFICIQAASRALAHVLIGALDEAAMFVATSEDRDAARDEVARVLHALVDGLLGR
jgi:hypothetical protein